MSAKNPPIHPARLFVLLAREAPIGVIFRRGGSDWTQMIKWHTDSDTFELGQWLRGDVKEYNGDLSPDGKLLLYHIYHKRLYYQLEAQGRKPDKLLYYTAICKPPYFTALELWQNVNSPSGQFIDNTTVQLYPYSNPELQPIRTVAQTPLNFELRNHDIEWTGPRITEKNVFLTNQGWETIQIGKYDVGILNPPHIWSKSSNKLSLYASHFGHDFSGKQGGSDNQLTYSVSILNSGTDILLKSVNWADFDQQGRLVLAKQGKLFSAALQNGELHLTELADFNANKPDPQPAPDWAQKW
jgi:hypothetical protein